MQINLLKHLMPLCVLSVMLTGCGAIDLDTKRSDRSASALATSISTDKTSALYLNIVDGLIGQGRNLAALAYLDQYAVSNEETPRYIRLRGDALIGAERYEEASLNFQKLLNTPAAPDAYNGLGRAAAAQKHWSEAATYFAQAVAARPASAEFLSNLGYAQLYLDEAQQQKSEQNLRQAYQLNPASDAIRTNLFLALLLNKKERDAGTLIGTLEDSGKRSNMQKFASNWVKEHRSSSADSQKDKN